MAATSVSAAAVTPAKRWDEHHFGIDIKRYSQASCRTEAYVPDSPDQQFYEDCIDKYDDITCDAFPHEYEYSSSDSDNDVQVYHEYQYYPADDAPHEVVGDGHCHSWPETFSFESLEYASWGHSDCSITLVFYADAGCYTEVDHIDRAQYHGPWDNCWALNGLAQGMRVVCGEY